MESEQKTHSDIATSRKIEIVTNWLLERKAQDLLALDLVKKSSLSESLVLVTASSTRHAQGMADAILRECRNAAFEFLSIEGYALGKWILLDLNDIIVHIFQEDNRNEYRLDDLWPEAKVIFDHREEK